MFFWFVFIFLLFIFLSTNTSSSFFERNQLKEKTISFEQDFSYDFLEGEIFLGGFSTMWGKVNLHIDLDGAWKSDSDCISGSNLNNLDYCKKFYPDSKKILIFNASDELKPFETKYCEKTYMEKGHNFYVCLGCKENYFWDDLNQECKKEKIQENFNENNITISIFFSREDYPIKGVISLK